VDVVFSDILISSKPCTDNEFIEATNYKSRPGYSDFKRFISGDYEYEKALYKTVMKSQTEFRPYVSELNLEVDVPDIFDRGSATISASGTIDVLFSRPFNVAPEVNLTLKSGTVWAIPRLLNESELGFTIQLRADGDVASAGVVGWSAHGY